MTSTIFLIRLFIVIFVIEANTERCDQCRIHARSHNDGVGLLAEDKVTAIEDLAVNASYCLVALLVDNIGTMLKDASLHKKLDSLAVGVSEGCCGLGADH